MGITRKIHILIGVFLQKHRHKSQVPGMLRIVFFSVSIRKIRLAENIFYLVYFYNKNPSAASVCPFMIPPSKKSRSI